MRSTLLAVAALIATFPLAQASCHMCVHDVVEECGSLDAGGCEESTLYMAGHYPQHLLEDGVEPSPPACARADWVSCL